MNQFLEMFLKGLIVALTPVVASLLADVIHSLWTNITERIKMKNMVLYEKIIFFASIAVDAAEQAGVGGLIEDKKTFAIQYLEKVVKDKLKLDLDFEEAAALIEATVWEKFNSPEAKRLE